MVLGLLVLLGQKEEAEVFLELVIQGQQGQQGQEATQGQLEHLEELLIALLFRILVMMEPREQLLGHQFMIGLAQLRR